MCDKCSKVATVTHMKKIGALLKALQNILHPSSSCTFLSLEHFFAARLLAFFAFGALLTMNETLSATHLFPASALEGTLQCYLTVVLDQNTSCTEVKNLIAGKIVPIFVLQLCV